MCAAGIHPQSAKHENKGVKWLRSTVGGTPVFGRRTDPVLRSTFRERVTTMRISQLGQLSLSSFRGR